LKDPYSSNGPGLTIDDCPTQQFAGRGEGSGSLAILVLLNIFLPSFCTVFDQGLQSTRKRERLVS
jgi:hypothetical protein